MCCELGDVLAKIGEFAFRTIGCSVYNESRHMVDINIHEDTMQECIDFVHDEFPDVDDDIIIRLINDSDYRDAVYDDIIKKDVESFNNIVFS